MAIGYRDFRSAVTSAAREVFAPQFPEYREITGVHENSLLLLQHRGPSGVNFFIMVGKRLEHDEFTVEAAWNVEDAYPRFVKTIRPSVDGVYRVELMREARSQLAASALDPNLLPPLKELMKCHIPSAIQTHDCSTVPIHIHFPNNAPRLRQTGAPPRVFPHEEQLDPVRRDYGRTGISLSSILTIALPHKT